MTILQNIVGSESEELFSMTRQRHGDFHPLCATALSDPSRKPQWGKVLATREWLAQSRDGDTALMLDADTVMHRAIATNDFPAPADLGMVLATYGEFRWLNSGVLFLRNGAKLRRFFADVWRLGPQPLLPGCPEGGEQGAINKALPASNLLIALMPNRYNAYSFAPSANPVISGFHGLAHGDKVDQMEALLAA